MDQVFRVRVAKTLVAVPARRPDEVKHFIRPAHEAGVAELLVGAGGRREKSSGDIRPVVAVEAVEEAEKFLVGIAERGEDVGGIRIRSGGGGGNFQSPVRRSGSKILSGMEISWTPEPSIFRAVANEKTAG